jgi:hypothetical protein
MSFEHRAAIVSSANTSSRLRQAERMSAHEQEAIACLHGRRNDDVSLDEVERIGSGLSGAARRAAQVDR